MGNSDPFLPTPLLKCLYCKAPLGSHQFYDLGVVTPGSPLEHGLEQAIDDHEWERLMAARGELSAESGNTIRVFRCPEGSGWVAPIRLSATLIKEDTLEGWAYMLNAAEVLLLTRHGATWQEYSESWRDRPLE